MKNLRRFAVLSVLLAAGPLLGQDWFKGTVADALAKAHAESKHVLLYFHSPG
jgi:hypothetical protein